MSDVFELTRIDRRTGQPVPVPAVDRIKAILERPNARAIVRSMDPQSLYALVHEAGRDAAWELLMVASGRQMQSLLDFECWSKDEFEFEQYTSWLEVVLQRDDAEFNEAWDTMDPEIAAMWLRERTRVLMWEDDQELLDSIDDPVLTSPCGQYAIVLPGDDSDADLIRLMLDRVYANGVQMGHLLLEATRWELTSEMQERAYEQRAARLGDMGFVPFHEAQAVFAWREPAEWARNAAGRARDARAEPLVVSEAGKLDPVDVHIQVLEASRLTGNPSMFVRALGCLPEAVDADHLEPVVDSVLSQFRALASRVLVADAAAAGSVDAMRDAARRADASLSIGLELAARNDDVLAASVLARHALSEIHQAGYSATARLQREARRLVDRGNLTLIDSVRASLLTEAQVDLIDGLLSRRPVLSKSLGRRFERVLDVERAAHVLSRIAFIELAVFGLLRFTRVEIAAVVYDATRTLTPTDLVSFRSILATLAVDALAGRRRHLVPLTRPELFAGIEALRATGDLAGAMSDAVLNILRAANRGTENIDALSAELASDVGIWFAEQVGPAALPLEDAISAQVVVLAP